MNAIQEGLTDMLPDVATFSLWLRAAFGVRTYIENVENFFEKSDFFQQIANGNSEILNLVNLADLVKWRPHFSVFSYVLMNDADLQRYTIANLIINRREDADIILKD